MSLMSIRVEFFGVPRRYAGVAAVDVEAQCLGEALAAVALSLPQLERVCVERGTLCRGYLANVNGQNFVSDPATPLVSGDCVLVLSSDMGG
jgi:molybdopterin converting factor small subunit